MRIVKCLFADWPKTSLVSPIIDLLCCLSAHLSYFLGHNSSLYNGLCWGKWLLREILLFSLLLVFESCSSYLLNPHATFIFVLRKQNTFKLFSHKTLLQHNWRILLLTFKFGKLCSFGKVGKQLEESCWTSVYLRVSSTQNWLGQRCSLEKLLNNDAFYFNFFQFWVFTRSRNTQVYLWPYEKIRDESPSSQALLGVQRRSPFFLSVLRHVIGVT